MTNRSLPQPAELVEAVEAYISELPEKRRRKRTREEIYNPDLSFEDENYGPEPKTAIVCELDDAAQIALPKLLFQLGKARSDAMAQIITAKIYDLLGLEVE